MPCSGPRTCFSRRSLSAVSASASASGFTSITLFNCGPPASTASMRAKYFSTNDRAVYLPDSFPAEDRRSTAHSIQTAGRCTQMVASHSRTVLRFGPISRTPTHCRSPAARNDRRLGRFGFGENRISRGTLLLRMLEHGDEKRFAVAPASPVIHRRRHNEPAMVRVVRVDRERVAANAECPGRYSAGRCGIAPY